MFFPRMTVEYFRFSQRRRAPAAKVTAKEEPLRPSSTTSNSSASSHGTSNSGSISGDNSLRRSGRIRRKPKRPFESSEEENVDVSDRKKAANTRNAGKRTVRYRQDAASDDDAKKSLQVRNRSSGRTSGSRNSSRILSDEDDENEDPRTKRQPNGAVKRNSRQSAREAAKKMRTDFESSEEEGHVAVPTNSVSSRGRVRKVVQYSTQEYFE